jgi:heptaprenyl diphosphate synthase
VPAEAWLSDSAVSGQLRRVEALLSAIGEEAAEGRPRLHGQVVSAKAKRLRPALLLLAARFGSRQPETLLERSAAGVELLHEATLYHDDIVDEADARRGEVTAQRAFGPAAAAFVGSELLYATAELFVDLPGPLRNSIDRCVEALCRGQLRELELLGDLATSVRERLRVMRDKTARLFALATLLGARLSEADEESVCRLSRFGLRLGMCFQLADDLADLTAPPAFLGRTPGADLLGGVYTLPVIHALSSPAVDTVRLGRQLQALMHSRDVEGLPSCSDLIRRSGGLEIAARTLSAWTAEADAEIKHLAPGAARDNLRTLLAVAAEPVTMNSETSVRAPSVWAARACTT